MNSSFKRGVGGLLLLSTLTLSTTNCGIILHPERSGHVGRRVDVVAVVLDCCWLLVGIVPGVVALVIDFATGGLYEGMFKHLGPGGQFGLNFKGPAPAPADVAITLTSPDGTVSNLASRHFEKGESTETQPVTLPEEMAPGVYKVAISVNGRENAHWALNIQ